jgi:alpha-mannosidase
MRLLNPNDLPGLLWRFSIMLLFAWVTQASISAAQDVPTPLPVEKPAQLSDQKTVYVVGYAHLDTQWRWSYPQVVNFFLANTLHDNLLLMDKYPHYIFNFTGARRYQLMKEYFPADYERMKAYVKAGRWFPAGSSVDECDQNTPNAESVVRQVLYGNHFFTKEFGVCGVDFMVPDCFGFPYSLPTVLSHCSIKGFSTQKLEWGGANDWWKEHPVGLWQGVDGETVITAFHPTGYGSVVPADVLDNADWNQRVTEAGKGTGVSVDYRYYGTGDRGGAPAESSIANVEKAVTGTGPIRVISATSDQMFRDITPDERAKLPVYNGDLLLTWHSAGSINSQGFMKRCNRKNELLADAAERASVAASYLGDAVYPSDKLYRSWMLLLECQMHDILPGDCLPVCYEYSWNDEILASNGFAAAEQDGVGGVATEMNTRAAGVPLVVYNPLSVDREDPVEATVAFPAGAPNAVAVTGPDGLPCPVQILSREDQNKVRILFLARVAGDSFATFDVQPAQAAPPIDSTLKVTPSSLENARYRVTLNADGDVAQVRDKSNATNLLSAPLRLAFLYENPKEFPAWNMDWEDRERPPEAYVDGPAKVRIVENGPVRVALEVTREARDSTFVQRIQLSAGNAGDRVEFPTRIDWQSTECSLEAVMPLAVAAPTATYDTQVGVTVRGNNNPRKYEVPQQQWFDVTAPDHHYGVSVLNDCKYGSDKPDDNTVRLTLLYTPGVRGGYQDEASQDFGKHQMIYALTGHTGDWRASHSVDQAARLNQSLVAFQTPAHPGPLGKRFQLLAVSNPQVTVQALKKAEDSDEIIVRLKETLDKPVNDVRLTFASPVLSAREVDGQEATLGNATIIDGALVVALKPFHLRAYAVTLAPSTAPASSPASTPIALPFSRCVVTSVSDLQNGAFDSDGRTYPAEQFPQEVSSEGITFKLGPTGPGQKNAVACNGQTVPIPAGAKRLYVLAASANGDASVQFKLGEEPVDVTVQDWSSSIGRWDNRMWKGKVSILTYSWSNRLDGLSPGWIKRDNVAWYADHRHDPESGNQIWQYCYLFKYGFDVPAGTTSLTLPSNGKVFIFAISTATGTHDEATPARPLYDTLSDHVRNQAPLIFVDADSTTLASAEQGAYQNSIHIRLQRPPYWQDGYLHYTTDGSDPTLDSPVYQSPLLLTQPATIKACQFDAGGDASPIVTQHFEVHDTTPPQVIAAQGLAPVAQVRVTFSKPVSKQSAEAVDNYRFRPPLNVKAAKLQESGTTVVLQLADATAADAATFPAEQLTVSSVRDTSPAANAVRPVSISVDFLQPLIEVSSYSASSDNPPFEQKVMGLPSNATEPWTINCMVRTDHVPENKVLIAGFGNCLDGETGTGRYLGEFPGGLHYWSCNQDVDSDQRLDAGRWQMLSAVWDGRTLTMYKDCLPIASGDLALSADNDGIVRLAPMDAWNEHHRFEGEIRNFTVWNVALSPQLLQSLLESQVHK